MGDPLATWFADYAAAFDAFDVERIAARLHCPCLMVSSEGAVALTTRDAIRANMRAVLDYHRSEGYARAEVSELRTQLQGSRLASSEVAWRVFRSDDSPLWQWRNTYQLADYGEGWRVLVATTHASDA